MTLTISQVGPRTRAALNELIRAVVQGGSSDDWQSDAQKNPLEVAGCEDVKRAACTTRSPKDNCTPEQDEVSEEDKDDEEVHEHEPPTHDLP